METEPYSIYMKNRPVRIVFFVSPIAGNLWVDKVIAYNREKWGGRLNPIILTDGSDIQDDWWKFLRQYDPDIIFSTLPLTDALKRKIHIFLSPLRVEEVRSGDTEIRIDNSPISIAPTAKNISQIGQSFFDEKRDLIMFEVDKATPTIIKTFLERNFSLLGQDHGMTYQLRKALDECNVKRYMINDDISLNNALLDLAAYRGRFIFPSQICAIPNSLKEASHTYLNEDFEIIVGDTVDEAVHFWNRTIELGTWQRTSFTQMWLPRELATNAAIKPGLGKIINRYVLSTGNEHSHGAHFVTLSLTPDDIKAIQESFSSFISYYRKRSTRFAKHSMPQYEHHGSPFSLRQGLAFHRAHSNVEYLVIDEPDVEQSIMAGEHWFVDLYIQYRPERFKTIIGNDYWWQLPKRNSVLRDLHFFSKAARINEQGMFSVLMSRRTSYRPDEDTLVIRIPDDQSVFYALTAGESYESFQWNRGEHFRSSSFYHIRQSDKGMYLSGVLGLFPDLFNAHLLFERRYWRTIFEQMSNSNPDKDQRAQFELVNKLKRKLSGGLSVKDESKLEWLAHNVVNIAKKYSKEEIDLNYTTLRDLAQKETNEYNKATPDNVIEFSEKSFKEELSDLVESGIFLLGVKPRCPRCGYRIWYQVDDIKQETMCRGCGHHFALPAEPEWIYRLNSLLRAAVSLHGTVPVLITLGQIMRDARSAAIFMPSFDLLRKGAVKSEELSVYGEIDLACIKDGQFIIGEIKQSCHLFDVNDFRKMSEVAKLIKPDLVIFSSMDREPNKLVKENIDRLAAELVSLEISVKWYPINSWVFEPQPVR